MVFADARASHCWPQVGAAWMPQSSQEAVRTPGKHAKSSLAGVFHLATGASVYGPRSEPNHCALSRPADAARRYLRGSSAYPHLWRRR